MAIRAALRRSLPRSALRLAQARLLARVPPPSAAALAARPAAARPSKQSLSSKKSAKPSADAAVGLKASKEKAKAPKDHTRSQPSSSSSRSDGKARAKDNIGLVPPRADLPHLDPAFPLPPQGSRGTPSRAADELPDEGPSRPSPTLSTPREPSAAAAWTPFAEQPESFDFDFGLGPDALGVDLSTIPLNPFAAAAGRSAASTSPAAPPQAELRQRRKRVDDWSIFGSAFQPSSSSSSSAAAGVDVPSRATAPQARTSAPSQQASAPDLGSSATAGPSITRSVPPHMTSGAARKGHALFWGTRRPSNSATATVMTLPGPSSPSTAAPSPEPTPEATPPRPAAPSPAPVLVEAPAIPLPDTPLVYPSWDEITSFAFRESLPLPRPQTSESTGDKLKYPAPSHALAPPHALATASAPTKATRAPKISPSSASRQRTHRRLEKPDLWHFGDQHSKPEDQDRKKRELVRKFDLDTLTSTKKKTSKETLRSRRRALFATWLVRGLQELVPAHREGGPSLIVSGRNELRLSIPKKQAADLPASFTLASAIDRFTDKLLGLVKNRTEKVKVEAVQELPDGLVLWSASHQRDEALPRRPARSTADYDEIIENVMQALQKAPPALLLAFTALPQASLDAELPDGERHDGARSPAEPPSPPQVVPVKARTLQAAPPPPAAFSAAAAASVHQQSSGQKTPRGGSASSALLPDGRLLVDSPWGLEVIRPNEASRHVEIPGEAPVWSGWAQLRARQEAPP